MPHLVLPSKKYKTSYLRAHREFEREGRQLMHVERGRNVTAKDFEQFLLTIRHDRKGIDLPKGRVPQTEYWLVEGSRYIGTISIRHRLNKLLREWGGHIGYAVRPSERKKGYGTLMLRLVKAKAKKLGLKKVLLTCDETNTGSMKVIQHNGGIYYGQIPQTTEHPAKKRYWIPLE